MRLGYAQVDELIKAARSQQCRIEKVGPVRRGDDKDLARILRIVQFGHQLRDDAVHHTTGVTVGAAGRRERINLVEEDAAGRRVACLVEDLSQRDAEG